MEKQFFSVRSQIPRLCHDANTKYAQNSSRVDRVPRYTRGHKIFMFDDCSTDDGKTRAVLDIYRQEGLVSLYDAEDLTRDECWHAIVLEQEGRRQLQQKHNDSVLRIQGLPSTTSRKAAVERCQYTCQAKHAPDENRIFRFLFRQIMRFDKGLHCKWVITFDPDEYLTIQKDLHPSGDLLSVLAEHDRRTDGFPVLHMPWVWMGSDNQEQRPPGLLIDNFHAGNYPAWMLKTAARAAYIENWDFSHWPNIKDVAREDVLAKHGFEIPEPFKSPTEYTARNWLFDNESRILHPDPFHPKIKCRYPVSPLFLKHYAYR